MSDYKVGNWVVVKSYDQAGEGNGVNTDNYIAQLHKYDRSNSNVSGMFEKDCDFMVVSSHSKDHYWGIRKEHIIKRALNKDMRNYSTIYEIY